MSNDQETCDALMQAALDAQRNAYAPYSKFQVGAAILTEDGETFVGCNVENSSFGLTICAERVAATAAVAGGSNKFEMIAIVSPGGVTPCGACRQFLAEFNPDIPILLVDSNCPEAINEVSLTDLFPQGFRFP